MSVHVQLFSTFAYLSLVESSKCTESTNWSGNETPFAVLSDRKITLSLASITVRKQEYNDQNIVPLP